MIIKNTDILITKSKEDVSNKTKKAKEMNIPVMIPMNLLKCMIYKNYSIKKYQ